MTQTKVPTDISVKLNSLSSRAAWPILWPHGMEAALPEHAFLTFVLRFFIYTVLPTTENTSL